MDRGLPDQIKSRVILALLSPLLSLKSCSITVSIELITLAAIPSGNGLGTSSIMGAVLISVINRLIGKDLSRRELFHLVLQLEQDLHDFPPKMAAVMSSKSLQHFGEYIIDKAW